MRTQVSKERAESRVVSRYHKLHVPLIELIQSLQDLVPPGMVLGNKVELTQVDGYIEISHTAKPVQLVLNDGTRKFMLTIEEVKT
jgi:hypothetical protein